MILELLRICVIALIFYYITDAVERLVFHGLNQDKGSVWLRGLGNFALLFVCYRNWFQFKGWYKSGRNRKLSTRTTASLVIAGVILVAASASM
ncbi:hypothetical protein GZH47_03300 [Paenibacillus rhizovicinus]|uniref:Uncharacterized protein n=1 Tax=Paenibacillus rhizovicinus TaxID=2704463 RepID=A0A6C0NUU5_9BACL|nr:hypothetical protein [Paenibacillus rhizovicinus]QHW29955.1 hypothetical protein GZH47_03300 [Paenibacillus rhizovicinus]